MSLKTTPMSVVKTKQKKRPGKGSFGFYGAVEWTFHRYMLQPPHLE